ncbi:MAG: FAD-dependent oxidoreductase, partial [bacterium]
MNSEAKRILVVGGGISGITAAVEAAEVGYEVILVEKEAYLGGRVMRMHQYFPKLCPPTCGMEINLRRIRQNPRITVYTLAEVENVSGSAGNFEVTLKLNPRYVTGKAPLMEAHEELVNSERPDDFNYGMGKTKALYVPHESAYPMLHVLDRAALSVEDKERLQGACPKGAIDFDMPTERIKIAVGSIVIATGWQPYDASKIDNLGFSRCDNVITNVMMERLASQNGPTNGKILRPSDGAEVKNVAFVQCAGSRDENHLPYCSAVC